MLRAVLAAALLVPLAACLAEPTPSCRGGEGEFFVRVSRTAGFGPAEWHERDFLESLDRDGGLFAYAGRSTAGSGRITFSSEGPVNLDAGGVRAELGRLGAYRLDRDYEVFAASRVQVGEAGFDRLCQVVDEEWATPRDGSGRSVGCDDGGTATFDLSTARGATVKVWRCDGSAVPQAEWESVERIRAAYQEVANAGLEAAGLR